MPKISKNLLPYGKASFANEDYGEFLKQAKKMDIPVAAIRETGKENTLSVFFNVKDKEAVNSIVQGIVREKMKAPEQTERMITIEKEQVEGYGLGREYGCAA